MRKHLYFLTAIFLIFTTLAGGKIVQAADDTNLLDEVHLGMTEAQVKDVMSNYTFEGETQQSPDKWLNYSGMEVLGKPAEFHARISDGKLDHYSFSFDGDGVVHKSEIKKLLDEYYNLFQDKLGEATQTPYFDRDPIDEWRADWNKDGYQIQLSSAFTPTPVSLVYDYEFREPKPVDFVESGMEKNGRTFIPLRSVSELLGARVDWNGTNQSVTITKDNDSIYLEIDSKTVKVNGKKQTLDVSPRLEKDLTMVPIRFVSEALGYNVTWNAKEQSALVRYQNIIITIFTNANGDTNVKEPNENPATPESKLVHTTKGVYMLDDNGSVWMLSEDSDRTGFDKYQKVEGLRNIVDLGFMYDGLIALDKNGDVWVKILFPDYVSDLPELFKSDYIKNVAKINTDSENALSFVKDDGSLWFMDACSSLTHLQKKTQFWKCHPIQVKDLANKNVVDFALINSDGLALTDDGTVWYVYFDKNNMELQKVRGIDHVTDIEMSQNTGGIYALLLKQDGTVWEMNVRRSDDEFIFNQLRNTPNLQVKRVGNLTNVTDIFAGNTSFVVKKDGTVWAWGANHYGQLGNGEASGYFIQVGGFMPWMTSYQYFSYQNTEPTLVEGISNIAQLVNYMDRIFALTDDGSLYRWGRTGNFIEYDGEMNLNLTNNQLKQKGHRGYPEKINLENYR